MPVPKVSVLERVDCSQKLWMTSYSFSLLPVFTKTEVVPGVGSNVLIKLIIKPFGIAHETKVLCSNEWSAKGIMHSVVHG